MEITKEALFRHSHDTKTNIKNTVKNLIKVDTPCGCHNVDTEVTTGKGQDATYDQVEGLDADVPGGVSERPTSTRFSPETRLTVTT